MRLTTLLVLLASCAAPQVGPDPALKTTTYDCDAPWVDAEGPALAVPVEDCFAGPAAEVEECVVRLVGPSAHPDSVACNARDRGTRASAAVAAGTADNREKKIAENVRTWVRSGGRSFR